MEHIVSFSGGKDSTALLLMMLEKNMPVDRVIFVDTTKEFPSTYAHIAEVEEYIKPLKIEKIKMDYDYWFKDHIKTRGKNKGKKGYGWPSFVNRWCTTVKINAFQHAVLNLPYNPRGIKRINNAKMYMQTTEYHGIAADEAYRTSKNEDGRNIKYPLVDWGITEPQALQYCYDKGFTWNGFYDKLPRASCYTCPLANMHTIKTLYKDFPELWQNILEMDNCSFAPYKSGKTAHEYNERFRKKEEKDGSI